MSAPACYACRTEPAGNDYAGPYSAYCARCQPVDPRPLLTASQCGCAACGEVLATLTDFDAHQVTADGVFTGECLDPASIGLELRGHVWGTPAGNRRRDAKAAQIAAQRRGDDARRDGSAPEGECLGAVS